MVEIEPVMVEVTLVCPTPDCLNFGVDVLLQVPEDCTHFYCGPCGTTLTPVSVIEVL